MEKITKYLSIALLSVLLVMAGLLSWQRWTMQKEITRLQQEAASKAETIELGKGQYQKLMQAHGALELSIDRNTKQGKELEKRLERTEAKLLAVTNATLSMKDEVAKLGGIINTPKPDGSWEFALSKTEGYLLLDGKCSTGPTSKEKSSCDLKLSLKPFRLTQVINQREDGSWAVDAALPEGIKIDFGEVAVNPRILKPAWYRRFNFSLLAAGNSSDGIGGLGLGYRLGQFNVSAIGLAGTAGSEHVYAGGSVTWYPWEK